MEVVEALVLGRMLQLAGYFMVWATRLLLLLALLKSWLSLFLFHVLRNCSVAQPGCGIPWRLGVQFAQQTPTADDCCVAR
jgi:hypothetical protein